MMILFDLRYYRLVKAVHEEETLTRAADKLHLTQSALSHQLKDLEHKVGFPVFNRVRNRMKLNEPGLIFLESSERILKEEICLRNTLEKFKNGKNGKLKIGLTSMGSNYWISQILKVYQYSSLELEPVFIIIHKSDVIDCLNLGQVDMVIIDDSMNFKIAQNIEVFEVASSENIFISQKENSTTQKIKKLITLSQDFYTSLLYQELIKNNLISSNTINNAVSQLDIFIYLIKIGFGVGIIDSLILKDYTNAFNFTYKSIDLPSAKTRWLLITTTNTTTIDRNRHFIGV